MNKGVEYLVEASAAEAEAINATLAAARAKKINGEMDEQTDRDRGAEATPSGKQMSAMTKMNDSTSFINLPSMGGVRLHHRAVGL